MSLLGLLLLQVIALLAVASPLASIRFVDDRGRLVGESLQVCFQVDLQPDCRTVSPGEPMRAPVRFQSLWVEGEDHGPVRRERSRLESEPDGSLRLAVPRKARLRLLRLPRDPLTVSLYEPSDPTFRKPAYRASIGYGELKIPAGDFIASFATPGHAPDLQRIVASPGAEVRATYRALPGWSILLRCLVSTGGKPLAGVKATLAEVRGYGQPRQKRESSASLGDGLVLFAGVTAGLATVTIEHPAFTPAEARGLTASPGTFAFQTVSLNAFASLDAHVTVEGHPLVGATCLLLQHDRGDKPSRSPFIAQGQAKAGADGRCRFRRVAPGPYKLRIFIPRNRGEVNRWLSVTTGAETVEEVSLHPAHVRGEVHLGESPAADYSVRSLAIDAYRPSGEDADDAAVAQVAEDGKYELTLWEPGWYSFAVWTPAGTPSAGHKELTLREGDDERVDFQLDASSLRGIVVDEQGRRIEAAKVLLRWQGLISTLTDAAGNFEIHVEGEGTGKLEALKEGYAPSETQAVEVKGNTPIPPIVLVLRKTGKIAGTIASASGAPVPGAWIASTVMSPESGLQLYRANRTGADGHFEVEAPPDQSSTLFTSGPGCPLSWSVASLSAGNADGTPILLQCSGQAAALDLTFVDGEGHPVSNAAVILRPVGTVIPQSILAMHLALLGLPATSDGNGRLVLPLLSPGEYDLFLNSAASESTIAAGMAQGFIERITLSPLNATELQVTVGSTSAGGR
jgi:hypothetical protein